MRSLLLLAVALSCVWGSSAADFSFIKLSSMGMERPHLRNESHVVPKQVERNSKEAPWSRQTKTTTLTAGDEVIIESRNYPDNYPNRVDESWLFEASDFSLLDFSCDFFDVRNSSGCRQDYLQITGFNTLTYRLCGTGFAGPILNLESEILVRFHSNRRGTAGGFSCSVKAQGGVTTTEATTTTDASVTDDITTGSPVTTEAPPPTGNDCTCGLPNTAARIVGGQETLVHQYPWQVALTTATSKRPYCGGSIISDQWVITAGHCIDGTTTSDRVVIGEHAWNTNSETSATERKAISQAIVHPGYNRGTLDNDIALLKLAEPITFSREVSPVCLATASNLYEDVEAVVTGWGTTTSGGTQPSQLNEVTVPTLSNAACKASGYSSSDITSNMICAGPSEGGKDSCQGDSGGPMVTGSPSMQQIGVVSWGYGCAFPNYPGVYTRVGNYVSWIESQIAGSRTCSPAQ